MSLYYFRISWDRNQPAAALKISESNLYPRSTRYEDDNVRIAVLGSAICEGKVDNDKTAAGLAKGAGRDFIRGLDGSFLAVVYGKKEGTVTIVNDRFASIPFFYYSYEGKFTGSLQYAGLWDELEAERKLIVNKEAFYEFICLQRLMGNKTYDHSTKYLDSATILKFDTRDSSIKEEKYWNPDFTKKFRPDADVSRLLADLASRSFQKRTSDGRRYGLLLSGGLDSRLVLAAADRPLACATLGFSRNNEYEVAKDLAAAKGYPHYFIKRPPGYYSDILPEAAFLGGAMNVYANAHFLGFDKELKPKADVFFHGHGFDYLFQGKYIPHENLRVFGRRTYIDRIARRLADVKTAFLEGVAYRLKSVSPPDLLKDGKKDIGESIGCSVDDILEKGRPYCHDAYDMWEYLLTDNLSRHYTFLNIASIRTFAEERTLAFDNQLFDLYLSLPKEARFRRRIFADAIRLLDERLCKIRNANTNFGVYDHGLGLTAKSAFNKALDALGLPAVLPPKAGERSWPSGVDLIGAIKAEVERLPDSAVFDILDFIDRDKIKSYVRSHLNGEKDYSDVLLRLATIDAFISRAKKPQVKEEALL